MIDPRRLTFIASAAAVLLASLAFAGCGSGGSSTAQAAQDRQRTVGHGGRCKHRPRQCSRQLRGHDSLHVREGHGLLHSNATGACATNWPPLVASGRRDRRHRCQGLVARGQHPFRRHAAGHLQRSPAVPLRRRQRRPATRTVRASTRSAASGTHSPLPATRSPARHRTRPAAEDWLTSPHAAASRARSVASRPRLRGLHWLRPSARATFARPPALTAQRVKPPRWNDLTVSGTPAPAWRSSISRMALLGLPNTWMLVVAATVSA